MWKKIVSVALSVVFLLGLSGFVWYRLSLAAKKREASSQKHQKKSPAYLVEAKEVRRGPIGASLNLTGTVEPSAKATVFSKMPGVLETLKVDEGDAVKKGQIIGRLEGWKAVLALRRAKAALSMAKIKRKNLADNHRRVYGLYEQKAIPKAKYDEVKAGHEAATAAVKGARAAVALASSQLSDTTLRAPIDGVILKRHTDKGEMITATAMMKTCPLVTIGNMDLVKIKVFVPETSLSSVKVGQKAQVRVDAYQKRSFGGKVTKIGMLVDPKTREIPITVQVTNSFPIEKKTKKSSNEPQRPLKAGMFARVSLETKKLLSELVIPYDAIIETEGHKYVFVVKQGVAKRKKVTVGIREQNRAQILSGISKGEKIIVLGHRSVRDGQPVRVSN